MFLLACELFESNSLKIFIYFLFFVYKKYMAVVTIPNVRTSSNLDFRKAIS
jgi:hypothetical protein